MGRSAWTVAGAVVGAYFGYPQLGAVIGGAIGSVVDPETIQGPRIGETQSQTSIEGAPRAIIYGTAAVFGNIIASGVLIKQDVETEGEKGGAVTSTEHCYRTYAVRICEGPIAGITRVWEDDKLVYDVRPGSIMLVESQRWIFGCNVYSGTEDQMPDSFLEILVSGIGETPAYRGTAYMVFVGRDLTDRRGSIPQYRFEVATTIEQAQWPDYSWTLAKNTSWVSGGAVAVGAGGRTVATGQGSESWQSDDLVTWNSAPIPFGLTLLAYGNDRFVGVNTGNNDQGAFSANGDFWSIGAMPLVGGLPLAMEKSGFAFGGGIFVAVGNYSTGPRMQRTLITVDGETWDLHDLGAGKAFGRLVYAGGQFVALCDESVFRVSVNGFEWTEIAAPFTTMSDLIYIDELSRWVLVGGGGSTRFAYGAALGSMTVVTGPSADYIALQWSPTLGLIVAVGQTGVSATSPDGINWTARATLPTETYTDLAYSPVHGKYVAASATKIATSDSSPGSIGGLPVLLSSIVDDVHARCGVPVVSFDTSELTDLVDGLVLAGDYTGADAINTLRAPYFFDKYEADKKIWYPKRGGAIAGSITIDDLVEEPDESTRKQAVEYPKKLHLAYQHAASGYAAVKATYARSSPDAQVVGEVTTQVPVVLNEDAAAQIVHKMFKVAYAEAEGEVILSVPESFLKWTPTDPIGVSLHGTTKRMRIEKVDHADGILKWTLKHDRQSAYTSALTGIPIALPAAPPSTITGTTVLAVLDIPARVDSEDDLSLLYGVSGALPAWYGAQVQRSFDAGANFDTAANIGVAAVMGSLVDDLPAASEFYTDRTNTVRVSLYRDTQVIESLTDAQFLSEQGAFAIRNADGSYEVLQYRDAVDEGGGTFALQTLHRGVLATGASAHAAGALVIMLDRATHVAAQSAWIGQAITHRAPSYEQSAELATSQTQTFVGRSQIEWPVAYLTLSRSGSNVVTGTWTPRHRFGSDDAPLASINFEGYRVTLDDGVLPPFVFNAPTPTFIYDVSAYGTPLTVSVSALNRITGAGPATSGTI